jgi:ankyrin repeat protein
MICISHLPMAKEYSMYDRKKEKQDIKDRKNCEDLVASLLLAGANPNAINPKNGLTPLYMLANDVKPHKIEPLYSHNPNLAVPCEMTSYIVWKSLIKAGANPHYQNQFDLNNTVLHRVAGDGRLIELVSNSTIKNSRGHTPSDILDDHLALQNATRAG